MKVVIFGKGKVGMATDLTLKINADFHDPYKGFMITDFSKYDLAFICCLLYTSDAADDIL
jgi:hypothetical protein